MSLPRQIVPAGHVAHAADPMDGSQLVQHNVRTLMFRASSPMPISDGHDEVSSLRKQLRHQQQTHRELQTMLKNQVLATRFSRANGKWLVKKFVPFAAKTRA